MGSFIRVLDNPLIDEIVVVDDCSDQEVFLRLKVLITKVNNRKIKLYRNKSNLGPLMNKYKAVKQCINDWVVLLDSDNIIDNDYINVVNNLYKEKHILYCPEKLNSYGDENNEKWNYEDYSDLFIDKGIAKNNLNDVNFMTMLNTGNYFFNKNQYIDVMSHSDIDVNLITNDALYFSYLWMDRGNFIKVVPNLEYIHRIHKGSWYLCHRHSCEEIAHEIIEKLKV
jgi:glycosyltransferase involved in cell wall biosynthesis